MTEESVLEGSARALESSLQSIFGNAKAMEYALRIALNTHQDPELLSIAWHEALPAIADAHRPEKEPLEHPMYHAGLAEGLNLLTKQIDAFCQARR